MHIIYYLHDVFIYNISIETNFHHNHSVNKYIYLMMNTKCNDKKLFEKKYDSSDIAVLKAD